MKTKKFVQKTNLPSPLVNWYDQPFWWEACSWRITSGSTSIWSVWSISRDGSVSGPDSWDWAIAVSSGGATTGEMGSGWGVSFGIEIGVSSFGEGGRSCSMGSVSTGTAPCGFGLFRTTFWLLQGSWSLTTSLLRAARRGGGPERSTGGGELRSDGESAISATWPCWGVESDKMSHSKNKGKKTLHLSKIVEFKSIFGLKSPQMIQLFIPTLRFRRDFRLAPVRGWGITGSRSGQTSILVRETVLCGVGSGWGGVCGCGWVVDPGLQLTPAQGGTSFFTLYINLGGGIEEEGWKTWESGFSILIN